MLKLSSNGDFAKEAIAADSDCDIWIENFDRYDAIMAQVFCQVDRGHAAMTKLALDLIAAGECIMKTLVLVRHYRWVWPHLM